MSDKPLHRVIQIVQRLHEQAGFDPDKYAPPPPQPSQPTPVPRRLFVEEQETPAPPTPIDPSAPRGPFDFRRQATLLHHTLQAAVPLWVAQLLDLRSRPPDLADDEMRRWAEEGSQYLAEHGDALMFRVPGVSAQAFNHLARGLAVMAFCPGGITAFGSHWEVRDERVERLVRI